MDVIKHPFCVGEARRLFWTAYSSTTTASSPRRSTPNSPRLVGPAPVRIITGSAAERTTPQSATAFGGSGSVQGEPGQVQRIKRNSLPKVGVRVSLAVVSTNSRSPMTTRTIIQRLAGALAFATVCSPTLHAQQAAFAWGGNVFGQLGDGTTTSRTSPVPVVGMTSGVTTISGGVLHSLAVRNGAAFAWGYNSNGQLGDGTLVNRLTPVVVTGLSSGVTAVSADFTHSLAIQNGAAFAWGANGSGQLGGGTPPANRTTPGLVTGLNTGMTAVSAGFSFSLGIQNGKALSWGSNSSGQLGDGTTTNRATPVSVVGLDTGVTAISAGDFHSLAVQNGAAVAWGDNPYGQLGDGTTFARTTPVQVTGLSTGVTAVCGGGYHSLAIKDGVVWAWGFNNAGQLGDGTTIDRSTPILVSGLPSNIIDIGAGITFSLALTSDNRLFAWGNNLSGQYGNGTTTGSLTPVEVIAPSGYVFTDIDGGGDHTVGILTPVPEPLSVLGIVVVTFVGARLRSMAYRRLMR